MTPNPFGALIALAVVYLVCPALRDWWHARSDRLVDSSYVDVCEALRGWCDEVDLPPFRVVVPLYDQDAEDVA